MPNAGDLEAARRVAARTMEEISSSTAGPLPAGLPALLRRCIRHLRYLDAGNQRLGVRCLLDALRNILSRHPSPALLPAIEVFAENLVFSDRLRSLFAKDELAAPEESRVFTVGPMFRSQFCTVLELVCNHFISALQGEGGFGAFLSALSGSRNELQRTPEISSRGALLLIRRTDSFSLPSLVRAHLLLLASRCISDPDLDFHLSAFEELMALYVDRLPALGVFNRKGSVKNPQNRLTGKMPFTCCIREVTHYKLENRVNRLLSFCQAHMGDDLPSSDSDICNIADRIIEENQHMINGRFRKKATAAVRSILSNVLHCAKINEQHDPGAEITEEIVFLAAVLRLMGSLLQHILHQFSRMRGAGDTENANHAALCSDYSILCDTIRLLSHYEADKLHRCDFIGTIGKPGADRENTSIQILAHFASLSVFCVRRRLGFLWRICVTMIMMAMNLVILEEKSKDFLELLIGASKEPADKANMQMQVFVAKRSTRAIASQWMALHNRSTEKTDGLAFLRSHPDYNPSWDDLADCIECEKDKDYSHILNGIKKFNIFKAQKFHGQHKSRKKRRMEDMQGM